MGRSEPWEFGEDWRSLGFGVSGLVWEMGSDQRDSEIAKGGW